MFKKLIQTRQDKDKLFFLDYTCYPLKKKNMIVLLEC